MPQAVCRARLASAAANQPRPPPHPPPGPTPFDEDDEDDFDGWEPPFSGNPIPASASEWQLYERPGAREAAIELTQELATAIALLDEMLSGFIAPREALDIAYAKVYGTMQKHRRLGATDTEPRAEAAGILLRHVRERWPGLRVEWRPPGLVNPEVDDEEDDDEDKWEYPRPWERYVPPRLNLRAVEARQLAALDASVALDPSRTNPAEGAPWVRKRGEVEMWESANDLVATVVEVEPGKFMWSVVDQAGDTYVDDGIKPTADEAKRAAEARARKYIEEENPTGEDARHLAALDASAPLDPSGMNSTRLLQFTWEGETWQVAEDGRFRRPERDSEFSHRARVTGFAKSHFFTTPTVSVAEAMAGPEKIEGWLPFTEEHGSVKRWETFGREKVADPKVAVGEDTKGAAAAGENPVDWKPDPAVSPTYSRAKLGDFTLEVWRWYAAEPPLFGEWRPWSWSVKRGTQEMRSGDSDDEGAAKRAAVRAARRLSRARANPAEFPTEARVAKVVVHRAEGPRELVGTWEFEGPGAVERADAKLLEISETAPDPGKGELGYDKTDVTVVLDKEFEPGAGPFSYKSRHDIKRGDTDGPVLGHLLDSIEYYASPGLLAAEHGQWSVRILPNDQVRLDFQWHTKFAERVPGAYARLRGAVMKDEVDPKTYRSVIGLVDPATGEGLVIRPAIRKYDESSHEWGVLLPGLPAIVGLRGTPLRLVPTHTTPEEREGLAAVAAAVRKGHGMPRENQDPTLDLVMQMQMWQQLQQQLQQQQEEEERERKMRREEEERKRREEEERRRKEEEEGRRNPAEPRQWGSLIDVYPRGETEVWYHTRPENTRSGIDWHFVTMFADSEEMQARGHRYPCPDEVIEDYVLLGKLAETDPEKIFMIMQGEKWSLRGEAGTLIRSLGLHHTSMSEGDVIHLEDGRWLAVAGIGFIELPKCPQPPPARREENPEFAWELDAEYSRTMASDRWVARAGRFSLSAVGGRGGQFEWSVYDHDRHLVLARDSVNTLDEARTEAERAAERWIALGNPGLTHLGTRRAKRMWDGADRAWRRGVLREGGFDREAVAELSTLRWDDLDRFVQHRVGHYAALVVEEENPAEWRQTAPQLHTASVGPYQLVVGYVMKRGDWSWNVLRGGERVARGFEPRADEAMETAERYARLQVLRANPGIDIDRLDDFERFSILREVKAGVPQEHAARVHVNTVEGDWSQLSDYLRGYAKRAGWDRGFEPTIAEWEAGENPRVTLKQIHETVADEWNARDDEWRESMLRDVTGIDPSYARRIRGGSWAEVQRRLRSGDAARLWSEMFEYLRPHFEDRGALPAHLRRVSANLRWVPARAPPGRFLLFDDERGLRLGASALGWDVAQWVGGLEGWRKFASGPAASLQEAQRRAERAAVAAPPIAAWGVAR